MNENQLRTSFDLSGRWQYRMRSILNLYRSTLLVSVRRLLRGPLLPNWSWGLETATHFMKAQASTAFDIPNLADGREYEDALVFRSPAAAQVNIEPVLLPVKGHWYQPKFGAGEVTVLYLHGGGYTYYSKAHHNLIALVTLAVQSRTFALDYRLCPEHPFPSQLEDALAAYRWLLEIGVAPERLVVSGDSAGGNLALALLLAIREARIPSPALAVCLAPWTDLSNSGDSMTRNAAYDWIEQRMARQWAEWFCQGTSAGSPLVSPIHADLKGLPPIYIQAGSAEILHDMICAFVDQAEKQGAQVRLDVWPNMTHDFQAFGDITPESKAALLRIREVARETLP
jgi:epsilon-lactone hydrolase